MAVGGGRFLASRLSLSCRRALAAAAAADFSAKSPLLGFVPRQAPIAKHFPLWRFCPVACSSSVVPSDEVTVSYANGLPVVSITLPSRKERCQFTLRPVLENVGDFLRSLQAEDRGIDRAAIYTLDGTRVAASTGVDILLLEDFKLVINEESYLVQPPKRGSLSADDATALGEVKVLVQQMYTTLRIEEHQLLRERELLTKLDNLRVQIEPLEKALISMNSPPCFLSQVKRDLKLKAEKRTRLVLWGGLAYMATQFGFLARLTWWEYSWDIMEPVTYFVTYGSAIAMYAYFILTRQEYIYPDARDRQYLHFFHRHAEKTRFDFAAYNKLKDDIAQAELDLKRLRDPLQLHLPTPQLEGKH